MMRVIPASRTSDWRWDLELLSQGRRLLVRKRKVVHAVGDVFWESRSGNWESPAFF